MSLSGFCLIRFDFRAAGSLAGLVTLESLSLIVGTLGLGGALNCISSWSFPGSTTGLPSVAGFWTAGALCHSSTVGKWSAPYTCAERTLSTCRFQHRPSVSVTELQSETPQLESDQHCTFPWVETRVKHLPVEMANTVLLTHMCPSNRILISGEHLNIV
jgi:hypothetical protein